MASAPLVAVVLLASALWIDVPFIAQDEKGCGAASIAMVLQYWQSRGISLDPSVTDPLKIMELLYSKPHDGILATDVAKYFERHGFQSIPFTGSWADIEHHLARGRPLIAGLQARGSKSQFHYVVLAGINMEEQFVMMNDPAERKLLKLTRSNFEKRWQATDRWTLLALPKQK